MTSVKPDIHTKLLPSLLDEINIESDVRVLLFRSGPQHLVSRIISSLKTWQADLSISLFCHEGEEIPGCENIIFPHRGYFRLDQVDLVDLKGRSFNLAIVPYATDRRLHPEYYELDCIASAVGAGHVIACYLDDRALFLGLALLEYKNEVEVKPYLSKKKEAVSEICGFTGEDSFTVEEKCDLAQKNGIEIWEQNPPGTEEEVLRFYRENDFYIYELMKECDWRGARSHLAEAVSKELKSGDRVLDYGGGCGAVSLFLAQAGYAVTYLDLPGPLLEFAHYRFRSRKKNIKIISAVERYPLTEKYDAIVCLHVIEHLVDPEGVIRHFAERLEKDGKLLLAIPFEEDSCLGGDHQAMHINRLSPKRYHELMAELGFQRIKQAGELDVFQRMQ